MKLSEKSRSGRAPSSISFDGTSVRLVDGFPDVSEPLLHDACDQIDMFLSNVANVRAKLDEMERLLRELREIHRHITLTPNADPECTTEMNTTVNRIKNLTQSISPFVQCLNDEVRGMETVDALTRMKKDHAYTLTIRFHTLLQEFNNEQMHYKQQCEKTIAKYLKISGVDMDEEEMDKAIEKGELFNTVSVMLGDRDKKSLYEDVKHRHDDILKLEESIRELHEIFQDMHMSCMYNMWGGVRQLGRRCGWLVARGVGQVQKAGLDALRARLLYQSKKRGILENDILVGGFADRELANLSAAELTDYDRLINGDIMEWDLYYYLSGKKSPPDEVQSNSAFKKMRIFVEGIKKQ